MGIALGEAAGNQQDFTGAGLLVAGHLKDGLDGFLLGGLDKAAGIDHNHFRLRRVIDRLNARPAKLPQQHLGIHSIFAAAQGHNAHCLWKFHGKHSLSLSVKGIRHPAESVKIGDPQRMNDQGQEVVGGEIALDQIK